ncbi:profilin-2-like [Orbicella faveolata]|uniref:profilin-2-like n=1 Tax=Orbicella faveolata TaxID=48498 RepID=UPI0009E1E2CF|nr:profilin-2-like [Orbicella faveolata]
MSWQTYVDSNLVGSGKVQKACIFGLDGSPWASSAGFSVSKQEALDIIKSLKDGSVAGKNIAGTKYMMLRNDTEKKAAYLKMKEKGGFCACLTNKALILGGYDEGAGGAGNCNQMVESLAEYLVGTGF